jgi:hypothetical protein
MSKSEVHPGQHSGRRCEPGAPRHRPQFYAHAARFTSTGSPEHRLTCRITLTKTVPIYPPSRRSQVEA